MKKLFCRFICACLFTGCGVVPLAAHSQDADSVSEQIKAAFRVKEFDRVIQLTEGREGQGEWKEWRATAFQERGIARFFEGDMKHSIADFNSYLNLYPEREPWHWQRGLAYYYAKQYQKGIAQFERHQVVNSNDVENAVWHFLCVVRAEKGQVEEARGKLIPIEGDSRVPMKEIYELFAGRGTAGQVLKAARGGWNGSGKVPERIRNQLCYAHLYLALYFEALGDEKKMKEHILLASGKFRMNHYMGKVAQLHARMRGLKVGE